MLKILYLLFGLAVIVLYLTSASLGWEFAASGRRSSVGVPFIYTGYRGGK